MTTRRTLLKSATALVAFSLATPAFAQSNEPIPVVATFSILGDMVERVGGDHIALTTLVGPDGDAHVYQPTPADARAVSGADILFVNGLAFEGWIDRLVEASDFDGAQVVATTGITPIAFEDDHEGHDGHGAHAESNDDHEEHTEQAGHDHEVHAKVGHEGHDDGAFDPHAWQSLPNAIAYVDNIAAALAQADPANAATFYRNRAGFVAEIEAFDAKIRAAVSALPVDRRSIVTSHDAFGYFAEEYGLTFLAPQGVSTESEASARDIVQLITQIRDQSIGAVFVESISDSRLLEQIASETDATIGGTLYSDALSGSDGPAATYLDMMRHNLAMLIDALKS